MQLLAAVTGSLNHGHGMVMECNRQLGSADCVNRLLKINTTILQYTIYNLPYLDLHEGHIAENKGPPSILWILESSDKQHENSSQIACTSMRETANSNMLDRQHTTNPVRQQQQCIERYGIVSVTMRVTSPG